MDNIFEAFFNNIEGSVNIKGTNNSVTINGKNYKGTQVVINGDGNVIVDGKKQGTIEGFNVSVSITDSSIHSVETISGKIHITGDVDGDVDTISGSVTCGNVNHSVSTVSGSVRAAIINGKVSTVSGSIHK